MRAITSIATGATVAVLSWPFLIHLIREVLHYGCEFLVGGEAGDGSWACADGIGYIMPGLGLTAPIFLASVVGLVATLTLRGPLARRIALGLSAAAPLAWAFVCTLFAARQYVSFHPDSMGVWMGSVVPALAVSAGGVLVLVVTRIRSARVDGIVIGVGLVLFVVAAALQPGLIPVLAVSAGFGVAATRPITTPHYVLAQ
jgi:hypothetical protein